MSLVTTADVQAALPGYTFGQGDTPASTVVQAYLDDVEATNAGLVEAYGGVWPTDTTGRAFGFIRELVINGTIVRVLRVVYAALRDEGTAGELDRADKAYARMQGQLKDVARALRGAAPVATGRRTPAVLVSRRDAGLSETFADWTERRHLHDAIREARRGRDTW